MYIYKYYLLYLVELFESIIKKFNNKMFDKVNKRSI